MRKRITRKKKQHTSSTFKIVLIAILLVMLSPFYYGHVVRIASTVWFKIKHASDSENYKTYRSFNIKIPKNYTIHGIDVSYYQGKIDWQKVVAMKEEDVRISFAFIKATEGLVLADPCFRRNWREAAKAGLSVGAYHFFRPRKSGLWQANFFLQNISIEKGHLPPVVDVESLDGVSAEQMREELKAFILQIEAKTKVKPIIYTGLQFYKSYLKGHFKGYPLWIANYYQSQLKLPAEEYKFWQHSDIANVNGINHVVDFNVFNGDSLQFQQMLIK